MRLDPILKRLDELLGDMESAKDEFQIALNLANISFQDYVQIKRGSLEMPSHLSLWAFEELNISAQKLKEKLDLLNKIRKELFVL